ncbi:strictosidine synthase family protein [Minicystis rosea]|nr:strictosidine synthase family protein [Minicystis rosea]
MQRLSFDGRPRRRGHPLAATCVADKKPPSPTGEREDIYVLRSLREAAQPTAGWCSSARTGFEPFPVDAERFFSF